MDEPQALPGSRPAVGVIADGLRGPLRTAYEAGRAAHPELALDFAVFAAGALRAIGDHLERTIGAHTTHDVTEALGTGAATDLYLARCCEEACDGAWERLHALYGVGLQGVARRRGLDVAEAEGVAHEVLADLATPPARGSARTVLGTFAGRGSLPGWLAVILMRRTASDARKRRPRTNQPDLDVGGNEADRRRAVAADDPVGAAASGEAAEGLRGALRLAWKRLTPKERLTLVLKYNDGLPQRTIAGMLGVGEPRVSRLVQQAVAKLQHAAAELAVGSEDASWPALTRVLEKELARFGSEIPPSLRIDPRGEARDRAS